jgi:hypothetical protein
MHKQIEPSVQMDCRHLLFKPLPFCMWRWRNFAVFIYAEKEGDFRREEGGCAGGR